MSQTDMDEQGSARVAPPIVLIFNAPQTQVYLEDNEVLFALFGERICRLCFNGMPELFFPQSTDEKLRLALFDRFREVSASMMPTFVTSRAFYEGFLNEIIDQTGLSPTELDRVKVIVADEELTHGGSSLIEMCERYFPKAALFRTQYPGVGKPVRIK